MTNKQYPEHEKMAEITDKSQAIGSFLEWAQEQGWHLAEWDNQDYLMAPIRQSIIEVLAKYFGIDLDLIEEEKRQMLAEIRELQESG